MERQASWLVWDHCNLPASKALGGWPLAWRVGKGRSREGVSILWFIFKYLSFRLLPLTLSRWDEASFWERAGKNCLFWAWVYLSTAIRTERWACRAVTVGRPRVECQAAALRRGRAFQSQRTELATCISEKLLIAFVSAKVANSLWRGVIFVNDESRF